MRGAPEVPHCIGTRCIVELHFTAAKQRLAEAAAFGKIKILVTQCAVRHCVHGGAHLRTEHLVRHLEEICIAYIRETMLASLFQKFREVKGGVVLQPIMVEGSII